MACLGMWEKSEGSTAYKKKDKALIMWVVNKVGDLTCKVINTPWTSINEYVPQVVSVGW